MILGLNGQSNRRLISLNEVKQHQTGGAMWTVLKGRVYNIAPYMKFHPGGTEIKSIHDWSFQFYDPFFYLVLVSVLKSVN